VIYPGADDWDTACGPAGTGDSAMSIAQYLDGRSFDPETLKCMGLAFDASCKRLGITGEANPFKQMVAERVVIFARRGDKDPGALCERVVRSL
jgi:hypothetical protein